MAYIDFERLKEALCTTLVLKSLDFENFILKLMLAPIDWFVTKLDI